MMPPKASAVPGKGKATAFKPPRPNAKPKDAVNKPAPRRKSAPARPPPSVSSDDENPMLEREELVTEATAAALAQQEQPVVIPPKLLTKLLHHHFEDEKTRISKDANTLFGKYMETFVREALFRAAHVRSTAGGGIGGDFLEVGSSFVLET